MSIFNSIFPVENYKYICGMTRESKAIYLYNYFLKNKDSLLIVTDTLYESNKLYQAVIK